MLLMILIVWFWYLERLNFNILNVKGERQVNKVEDDIGGWSQGGQNIYCTKIGWQHIRGKLEIQAWIWCQVQKIHGWRCEGYKLLLGHFQSVML